MNNNNEVSLTFIDPYYTFIINDEPGFALPITGGKGVYIFYAVGAAIIICAVVLLIRRKKK